MDCKEIITQYLKANGYDGLCNDGCGCELDDLAPCGQYMMDCKPAYRRKATKKDRETWYEDLEYVMTTEKPKKEAPDVRNFN